MKCFLVNIIFAFSGLYIAEKFIMLDYEKPLIFLSLFGSAFILFWLLTFFFCRTYFHKIPKIIELIGFIIKELIISNLRITCDILTPGYSMNPAIIAIPLDAKTDIEITTLSTLLTFAPGTLCLKVSKDKKTLFVHEMYIPRNDAEAVKKRIKHRYERRILEITR